MYIDIGAGIIILMLVAATALPLGSYMAALFGGERTFLTPVAGPLERLVYRVCGIDAEKEMSWKQYALSFTVFTAVGLLFLFALQLLQGMLPANPQRLPGVRWDTALNTAVSFVTNTNWQSYAGESTMSFLTQMAGLAVQNFLSAAAGVGAGLALIRGFSRRESPTVGNFWVDLTRSILYLLLPIAVVATLILMSQGVVQSLAANAVAHTLEGSRQVLPLGPAASQVAIKMLGTNGGGFFNANSAHPFENPTYLSNCIELYLILLLPVAIVFMFGTMIRNTKQGRAVFITMAILFTAGLGAMLWSEQQPNQSLATIGVAAPTNMEGKEVRFGLVLSALWSQATTVTSNGSVNSMHDSFMPLGGMVQMFNMGIGEVIFGGVGVGIIGFLFYVILAMFVAGLMIGRTPEFMGKKFGPYEMGMAVIALMAPMILLVIASAVAISTEAGLAGIANPSSHGLSEVLYAYSSAAGNNGSAFAGLSANTVFYNLSIALVMIIGRFATIIPALAVAGSLAAKKIVPESSATFPTTGLLFIVVVAAVIIVMGALTFFPVYSLGPILEHLILQNQGLL